MGTVLFNIFIRNLDEGIECTLHEFVDDTKLASTVDLLDCREALQKDLDMLNQWSESSCVTSNKGKRWVLLLRYNNPMQWNGHGEERLESCLVLVDSHLNTTQQCTQVGKKTKFPGLHEN